jgi:NAD(P)-dependent dehydrogenase (short-subunit alcohol dehydrogenase family)
MLADRIRSTLEHPQHLNECPATAGVNVMAAILISGAGRGIGLALTQQLAARGDRVIALCRTPSAALEQIENIRIIGAIDVTDSAAIERLAAQLDKQALDVIIHNAGVLSDETLTDLNIDRIHHQFAVNAVAPLHLTQALLPNLRNGSKVVVITSRMGSIDDNSSGGMYGYRMSKAALNIASKSLAIDLKPAGIAVGIFHPGFVATEMTHGQGIDPQQAVAQLIARIDQLTLASSGQFLHANGDPLPW